MNFGILALLAWLLAAATPVIAAPGEGLFTRQDLKHNSKAENIFVCSDFAGFDSSRIERFFASAFPQLPAPNIYDQYQAFNKNSGLSVLVFFSTNTPSEGALQCLDSFLFLNGEIKEVVFEGTQILGKSPADLGQYVGPFTDLLGPVQSTARFRKTENFLFMAFLSLKMNNYYANEALISLFGLDRLYCRSNPICENDPGFESDRKGDDVR